MPAPRVFGPGPPNVVLANDVGLVTDPMTRAPPACALKALPAPLERMRVVLELIRSVPACTSTMPVLLNCVAVMSAVPDPRVFLIRPAFVRMDGPPLNCSNPASACRSITAPAALVTVELFESCMAAAPLLTIVPWLTSCTVWRTLTLAPASVSVPAGATVSETKSMPPPFQS